MPSSIIIPQRVNGKSGSSARPSPIGSSTVTWKLFESEQMKDTNKMFALIGSCEDPSKLRSWQDNARKAGRLDLADAAFRRLIAILPEEAPGTVEHDFWQTVHAFEHILKEERGK